MTPASRLHILPLFLILVLLLPIPAPSTAQSGNHHGDHDHDAVGGGPAPLNATDRSPDWNFTEGPWINPGLSDSQVLYTSIGSQQLVAFNLSTGEPRWTQNITDGPWYIRASGSENVYAQAAEGGFVAVSKENGSQVWKVARGWDQGTVIENRGRVHIIVNESLQIRNPANGTVETDIEFQDQPKLISLSPTGKAVIAIGSKIQGIDTMEREEGWTTDLPSGLLQVLPTPDEILFLSGERKVYRLDQETGDLSLLTEELQGREPATRHGLYLSGSTSEDIYLGTADSILAFSLDTGEQLWSHPVEDLGSSIPSSNLIPAEGRLHVLDNGSAYTIDQDTGETIRTYAEDHYVTHITARGNTVYLTTFDNYLYELDASSGEAEWRFRLDHYCCSVGQLRHHQDTLIVTNTNSSTLHAFQIASHPPIDNSGVSKGQERIYDPKKDAFPFTNRQFQARVGEAPYPDITEVQNTIAQDPQFQEWPSEALDFFSWVHYILGKNTAQRDGYCYGMVIQSIEMFQEGQEASQASIETVADTIQISQDQQLLDPWLQTRVSLAIHGLIDQQEEYARLKQAISPSTPVVIGLIDEETDFSHAVAGYELTEHRGRTEISIYDPNTGPGRQEITITEDGSIHLTSSSSIVFEHMLLLSSRDSVFENTEIPDPNEMIAGLVHSPAELQLLDDQGNVLADTTTTQAPDRPHSTSIRGFEKKLITYQTTSPGDYSFRLIGTGPGNYTLEGYVINQTKSAYTQTTGAITEGELHDYNLIPSSDSETLALNRETRDGPGTAVVVFSLFLVFIAASSIYFWSKKRD